MFQVAFVTFSFYIFSRDSCFQLTETSRFSHWCNISFEPIVLSIYVYKLVTFHFLVGELKEGDLREANASLVVIKSALGDIIKHWLANTTWRTERATEAAHGLIQPPSAKNGFLIFSLRWLYSLVSAENKTQRQPHNFFFSPLNICFNGPGWQEIEHALAF